MLLTALYCFIMKRERKPTLAVEKDLHALIRRVARDQRDKIEVVVEDLLVTGLKVKRLLPEDFRQQDSNSHRKAV